MVQSLLFVIANSSISFLVVAYSSNSIIKSLLSKNLEKYKVEFNSGFDKECEVLNFSVLTQSISKSNALISGLRITGCYVPDGVFDEH